MELANDSKYGLGAGIWTKALSQAHRVAARIETGLVWVNTHHRNDPSSPWFVLLFFMIGILNVDALRQGWHEGEWNRKRERRRGF